MFIAMESKRLSFSEPFLSQRRKVISGFSFGIGASLAIFIVLLLNNSLKVPKVQFLLQGFDSVDANSSFASWPFSLSNNPSSTSSSPTSSASNNNFTASSKLQHAVTSVQQMEKGSVVDRTPGVNVSDAPKNDAMKSYVGNLTQEFNNVSLHTDEQRVQQKIHEANGTLAAEKVNQWGSIGQGVSSSKIPSNNSSDIGKNVTLLGEESRITVDSSLSSETNMEKQKTIEGDSLKNSSFSTAENDSVSSASYSGKPGVEGKYEGNSVEKNNVTGFHHGAHPQEMRIGSYENCDIFYGKWIRDDSKPYYPLGSCPHIDRDFDCHRNGRPDGDYVKWKWQPNGCNMPSLNATDFLERLRGQKLVFVGDSLNRNMWESLVCILRQSLRYKKRVYEISGRTEFKKKGFYAFRFEDYNCSVDFVGSPFLVRESTYAGKNESIETLRLDLMDQTTSMYQDADIIIFNTGHWWTHEKTSRGEDYYQEGNHVYPRLKVLNAYTRALTTWARWIDHNIDANRTQVFFRGYSLTHFRGGQWNSGGQCNKEIEPIINETYLRKYPSKMRALEHVIAKMKTPVVYMNISKLTDYRKDGHPSIYRMQYKTETDRNSAELYQDCSHWCLPGVPDTWNELLYATLLKNGKGSWKN